MYNPIKTIKTNTLGTINMLGQYSVGYSRASSNASWLLCVFCCDKIVFIYYKINVKFNGNSKNKIKQKLSVINGAYNLFADNYIRRWLALSDLI